MGWTCTSRSGVAGRHDGFSVVELMVGLALALLLIAALAPLWLSLAKTGAEEADRTVALLQSRVALARFEQDLRLATAAGCPFSLLGPVLEASETQVVFLTRRSAVSPLMVVEWEIAKGSLMRRWGLCPATRPGTWRHSLYVDNKAMMEGIRSGSAFHYSVNGRLVPGPLPQAELDSVQAVLLDLTAGAKGGERWVAVATEGRVGR